MKPGRKKILIVDDDRSILRSYEKFFSNEGFFIKTAENGVSAFDIIPSFRPHLMLLDLNMPKMNGIELLEKINREFPENNEKPLVIAVTAYGDINAAVKTNKLGVYDFLAKPVPLHKLRLSVERAFEKISMKSRIALIVDENSSFERDTIIGRSPEMVDIYKTIADLADNRATVFISGESGTGKEIVAKSIHKMSSQKNEPFLPVNCAAIPGNLIESELMGYKKGSFTDAKNSRKGKLDDVKKGTLLLDEITELPQEFQAKLLRLLQDREFYPIGSSRAHTFEGRIIATTNSDIETRVREKNFREDLFHRLNVVRIHVPPLRSRMRDLEMLVSHFLYFINRDMGRNIEGLTGESLQFLKTYSWPGNVRELKNAVTKAAISSKDTILTRDNFSFLERSDYSENKNMPSDFPTLKSLEKNYIVHVLSHTEWHKIKTSEILGISRPTLDKKIKEYGIKKDV